MSTPLPFSLKPAPRLLNSTVTVDLGTLDAAYAGWVVVLDRASPISVNELAFDISNSALDGKTRIGAMIAWIKAIVLAWNFVDRDGVPLPQPREGGAELLPQALLAPISQAYAASIEPAKNS